MSSSIHTVDENPRLVDTCPSVWKSPATVSKNSIQLLCTGNASRYMQVVLLHARTCMCYFHMYLDVINACKNNPCMHQHHMLAEEVHRWPHPQDAPQDQPNNRCRCA